MKLISHASVLSTARTALLIALAAASFAPAPAAAQGDPRQACSGDAMRLCGQFIPDPKTTGACLARMRASLSPECKVFFTPKKTAQRSTRHRRHR